MLSLPGCGADRRTVVASNRPHQPQLRLIVAFAIPAQEHPAVPR